VSIYAETKSQCAGQMGGARKNWRGCTGAPPGVEWIGIAERLTGTEMTLTLDSSDYFQPWRSMEKLHDALRRL
jgi:hypothetical protein